MSEIIPCTEAELKDLRERAAQAACRYCSGGCSISHEQTHYIYGGIGTVPEIVWCEGRAIRKLPLVEHR